MGLQIGHDAFTYIASVLGGAVQSVQSNRPTLVEQIPPAPAAKWVWTLNNYAANFKLNPVDGAAQTVNVECVGFTNAQWGAGLTDVLSVTVSNVPGGGTTTNTYPVPFALRTIHHGYTAFEGQTGGGNAMNLAGAEGFDVTAAGFGPAMPLDLAMTFDAMGAVKSCTGTIAGTENDSVDLSIKDGGRQASAITVPLSLRNIKGGGYTLFAGQTGGDDGFSAAGNGAYTVNVDGYGGGLPGDVSISVGAMGAVTACTGTIAGTESGSMTLSVTDGARPRASFDAPVLLRAIKGGGYTLFAGQTGGDDGFSTAGNGTYLVNVDGYGGGLPGDVSISVGTMGAVTACTGTIAGTESGSMTLSVTDGSRPKATFDAPVLLRTIRGGGYTLFAGQTGGDDGFSAAGAGTYSVSIDDPGASMPADLALTLSTMGRCAKCTGTILGGENDTMILSVTDGARPKATFPTNLQLRKLNHTTFYWFDNQTAGGTTSVTTAAATGSYSWSKTEPAVTLTSSGAGSISATVSNNGGAVGTHTDFSLTIRDGTRPASAVPVTLERRHVKPDPVSIAYAATGGSVTVDVQKEGVTPGTLVDDTATPWDWGAGARFGVDSTLTFTGTPIPAPANAADITWSAGGLDAAGDDGTLTFTLAPHGGAAPVCTIELDVHVGALLGIDGPSAFTVFAARSGAAFKVQDNAVRISVFDPGDWDFAIEGTNPGITVSAVDDNTAELAFGGVPEASWKTGANLPLSLRLVGGPAYPFTVSLRHIDFVDFLWFDNQTSAGAGVAAITGDPNGGTEYAWTSSDATVSISAAAIPAKTATVTDGGGSVGTPSTFTLSIADGGRPSSQFTSATLLRGHVQPDPASISYGPGSGNVPVSVQGDTTTPWTWAFVSKTSIDSTIAFPSAPSGNAVDITWGAGGLDPAGDDGRLKFDLNRAVPTAPTPKCEIEIRVVVGALVPFDIDVAPIILPDARERMRYQTVLTAGVAIPLPSGHVLDWDIVETPMKDVFELVDKGSLAANQKLLRTKVSGSSVTYIPEGWGGTTQAFTISVTEVDGSSVVQGAGTTAVSLVVADTKDTVDVALLVDRSGSMTGTRWAAAMSGAAFFAQLVRDANISKVGDKHRAGLYWFWGRNGGGTSDYPGDPEPGYPEGLVGTFSDTGGAYDLAGGQTLATPELISTPAAGATPAVPAATGLAAAYHPNNCTALGAGLLHCKDALTDAARERVILALTDGMENRPPMLNDVFTGATPLWGSADLHKLRIYASALLTASTYADKLRSIVALTGGVGALDVKYIGDAAQFGLLVQKWFVSSFKSLFGFTALDEIPDPDLAQGQWATHEVPVHLGCDKVVFYSLYGAPDASQWDFGVIPPGQSTAIYFDGAPSYPGVKAVSGAMYKALVIDLPLRIPGQEHRWAGTWKMVVERRAAGTGKYAVGALAHQDMGTRLEVIAPTTPIPGEAARLRAFVRDQDGAPVTGAVVTTTVHEPGPWPGNEVAIEVCHNVELVKKLRRSASKANADLPSVADGVLRDLYEREEIRRGVRRAVALAHIGNGVYEAEIPLRNPGPYDFDTTITGARLSSQAERDEKLGAAASKLDALYGRKGAALERAYLRDAAGAKQRFVVELRDQLAVAFAPTIKDSEAGGYFSDASTIRLLVQPKGKGGVLLGPGYREAILFFAPGGVELPWPATDLGDGNYAVDIAVRSERPIRLDPRRSLLASEDLSLVHPALGEVLLKDGRLPLAEFAVEVLGVRMPIAVWSLVGNTKSKQCHLVTCAYAGRISPANTVWMHDLKQARAAGFDTCEHCLPLVCNTNPRKLEVHKPFCPWVPKIKAENRLEVHGIDQALALGFDGCEHCLKKYHTR
jgi:hypothetical protein